MRNTFTVRNFCRFISTR